MRNSGTITATLGTVGLAAGNGFTLDFYGDKLITLAVGDSIAKQVVDVATGQPLKSLVDNSGTLSANGGRVQITAAAAKVIVDSVINTNGVIEANAVASRGGTIVLAAATAASKPRGAPAQNVRIAGSISARGANAGQTGGKITIAGENISATGAKLDASGQAGGGTVLVGGDVGGGKGNPSVAWMPQAKLEAWPVETATTVSIDAATSINASVTLKGDGGKVVVWSDQLTSFAGLIKASGGTLGGNGGFIETSGHTVDFTGIRVNTSAPAGKTGTWLVDPTDLTVDSAAAATIANNLVATNVALQTTAGGASGPGVQSPGNGDITVASGINWNSSNTLTLTALNNVAINAPLNGTLGGLAVSAGNAISATAAVNVGRFTLQGGAWSQVGSNLPAFSATDFRLSGGSFLRALGGDGSSGNPYQLTDVYGLQGIGSSPSFPGGNFVLANNIDASGTANWNGGAGFVPIGNFSLITDTGTPFTGVFDGHGHTIDHLAVNFPIDHGSAGLFGYSTGVIRNVGVTHETITATSAVAGGLVGRNEGLISHSYATVTITISGTGGSVLGGVAGFNTGTISQSSAVASITSQPCCNQSVAGSLAGDNVNGGTIMQSYGMGSIQSYGFTAGLVGFNENATIKESYAGAVTLCCLTSDGIGGLVDHNQNGTVSNSYWDKQATGQSSSGGGIGLTTAQLKSGLPTGFDPTVWASSSTINNGYPYLLWQTAGTPAPAGSNGTPPIVLPPGTMLSNAYYNNLTFPINWNAANSTTPVILNSQSFSLPDLPTLSPLQQAGIVAAASSILRPVSAVPAETALSIYGDVADAYNTLNDVIQNKGITVIAKDVQNDGWDIINTPLKLAPFVSEGTTELENRATSATENALTTLLYNLFFK